MKAQQQYYDATHIKWLRENLSEQGFRDWLLAQSTAPSADWIKELEQQIIEDKLKDGLLQPKATVTALGN